MLQLVEKISQVFKKEQTVEVGRDLLASLHYHIPDPIFQPTMNLLADTCERKIVRALRADDIAEARKWTELHREVLGKGAPYIFDMYMLYMEWNRQPDKQFYKPRRKQLRPLAQAMQELEDDKLDVLGLSLPPGVGKTTLALFFLTWLAGRHPDLPCLTGSHSNEFIRGCYDQCLRLMSGEAGAEYLYKEIFPNSRLVNTNAKDCRIDMGKRKRYETLQFTTVGSGNAGLYRAMKLLYCDDLISGLEVALSKDRLDKLWDTYNTDLRQRKLGKQCKELHIATRWSVHDPIGRLERKYEGNPRVKFISCPALNEKDESNFDYPYGVGFTTKFYHEQRDMMPDLNWKALYMNEPIEREGLLYDEKELRYFFDLPEKEPDAIWAVCDTKDRGTDYCVMPIAFQYGADYYIEDILCDNGNPDVIDERLVQMLMKYRVQQARFESNSAGGRVAADCQEEIKKRGGRTRINTKFSTANKETKIIVQSGFVKEQFLFRDKSNRSKEYSEAMRMLCGWTMAGRNKHDDVPDAMAMLADYVQNNGTAQVQILKRIF